MLHDILYEFIKDKELRDKIFEDFEKFFFSKSQTFQVLTYFFINKEGKADDLSERKELKDYQISTLLKRLKDNYKLELVDKEGKFHIYKISEKGKEEVGRKINNFITNNFYHKELLADKRKKKVENNSQDEFTRVLISALIDANIREDIKGDININLKKLAETNPEAVDLIYGDYKRAITLIKNYYNSEGSKLIEENIIFTDAHESTFNYIPHFDRDTKELIYTKGLVSSKKEIIVSKSYIYNYLCTNNSCKYSSKPLVSSHSLKTKGGTTCPLCKSPMENILEERINLLESKITDIESGISFHLHILGKKTIDFAYIGLGDEIEVIGHLEDKVIEDKEHKKEIVKVLVVNSFKTTDYIKDLTCEEKQEVLNNLSNYSTPKDYLLLPFANYIEQDWIKELFLLQQLTKLDNAKREIPLNIALMGEPGVGKNELIKISEEFFPCCDAIVGADITDAGFKGTVNRETGIKEVGMAKKSQGGTIFFNEFDKFVKSNPNGKKAGSQLLNASITEQEIRLNKAGIRIRMKNLNLRHNIVFNPLDDKINENKTKYDLMGQILDKSLLSRMLPIYIGKDNARTRKVFDVFIKGGLDTQEIEKETYKLTIRYLRALDVEFTTKSEELLKDLFDKILEHDQHSAISVERIAQMILQLCKAYCRLHNKTKCDKQVVEQVQKIYWKCLNTVDISLENMDQLFLEHKPSEIKEMDLIRSYIKSKLVISTDTLDISTIKRENDTINNNLIEEVWKDLIKSGDYVELPKGKLRRS